MVNQNKDSDPGATAFVSFLSYLPLCDDQSLPTNVALSNIPEVWQSLRLRPRGKRIYRLNWFRKSQKKTKLLKVQVPGQLTGPVSASASYWSELYTSATLRATAATPDLHTLRSAVKASGRAHQAFRSQTSTSPVTKLTTTRVIATITTASLVEDTLTTATRRTATLPTTKEWKL